MKRRFVGHFFEQAKHSVSDWSLRHKVIMCRCRLLKKRLRLIRAENKRTQLCLQMGLAEEITVTSFTEGLQW